MANTLVSFLGSTCVEPAHACHLSSWERDNDHSHPHGRVYTYYRPIHTALGDRTEILG